MKEKKLISIIIPTYNSENTIKQCLTSIYSQPNINNEIEIIVVDDGSEDETTKIVSEFNNVKLYKQKNCGVGSARNIGLNYASGKYVWFVDSDDCLVKNSINNNLIKLLNKDYDLIIFGLLKRNNNSIVKIVNKENLYFSNTEWYRYFENVFSENLLNPLWNKIYKRNIIINNNISFNKFKSGEDAFFNCTIIPLMKRIYVSNCIMYEYNLFTSNDYKSYWNKNLTQDNVKRISALKNLMDTLNVNKDNIVIQKEIVDSLFGEEINILKKYQKKINFKQYRKDFFDIKKNYRLTKELHLNKRSIKNYIIDNTLLSYIFIKYVIKHD